MRDINTYVLRRFRQHLRGRSQRGWQFPTEETAYTYFARQGLVRL